MESAVLSAPSAGGSLRAHIKSAASALCARTLPKQRVRADPTPERHHTYPRAAHALIEMPASEPATPAALNGVQKLTGKMAREVASAWSSRIGPSVEPAPADRVQSLFNDLHLYPTKTQVFEMLVCARQCARRKSLTLTFGEFCVFAAELRRCSRRARQVSSKPDSPSWASETPRDKELLNPLDGGEVSPPPCEVFLGGSCNPTTWRSDIAIPMLEQMGITYFNPQVEDWSTELVEVEHRAKAEARALLFVLDSETRAVAASVEAAQLAALPRDLLLVLKPYRRHQRLGHETISDHEYVELSRARAMLQEAVERRGLPAFSDIPAALRCARAVLRGARTNPRQPLGQTILRLKRAFDAASGRASRLPRAAASRALRDIARVSQSTAENSLPRTDTVDFETFCAAVAEITATENLPQSPEQRNGHSNESATQDRCSPKPASDTAAQGVSDKPRNGFTPDTSYSTRLKSYGKKLSIFIPKVEVSSAVSGSGTGGTSTDTVTCTATGTGTADTAVFTPGTEQRLERLPDMLKAYTHDVYLAGTFPPKECRPEEKLKAEGLTYLIPRLNDYTRMFSAPHRRTAPAHPESPRTDKKPRSALELSAEEEEVQLRDKEASVEPNDRLSASDFYTVTEDLTPQPFKGSYEEEPLWRSRALVFSMTSDRPCFGTMVLAAHYMTLRPRDTALLVQMMEPGLAAPTYNEAATKDYNRGRHYLKDLARRSGVPVFEHTEDLVGYLLNKLRATS